MQLEEISDHYDKASRYYDALTGFIFQRLLGIEKRYRQRSVSLLGSIDGAHVLDIGCGTGRNFPYLVSALGEAGSLVGVEPSFGMLAKARDRARRNGWSQVVLTPGDAARLRGIEPPFDAVISTWCLGIVYDLQAALERAVAVLRPGGRLVILDFQGSRPERGLLRYLYPVYSRLLQVTGIDTAEDLDHDRLKAKWTRGRAFLESRLDDYHQEEYLGGLGILISGTKPYPG
ncbi:methyltransferase domain-containing protein [Marinobacter halodurans]|uniref:Methyltransferase domain-containing protein n=1 Tax=Marinobacter halodurans TaxID=2528979 RepID=A0ABY1ZF76_9GAMM|nr:methyltransferase domain-containing protein [Marinobacter halodurans]TBW49386.1 methyltransferase domain-containing protein [Marinobacter halodurans]